MPLGTCFLVGRDVPKRGPIASILVSKVRVDKKIDRAMEAARSIKLVVAYYLYQSRKMTSHDRVSEPSDISRMQNVFDYHCLFRSFAATTLDK